MEKEIYLDFDGVILDSQQRYKKIMHDNINLYDWIKYLSSIKWHEFLRECNEIDDSIETIIKLQECNKLKGIVTRIHGFNEATEKAKFLREKGVTVPIFYVMPEQDKSAVVVPNENRVLIDDDMRNCVVWEEAGGKAMLLDPNSEIEDEKIIKSLKSLL